MRFLRILTALAVVVIAATPGLARGQCYYELPDEFHTPFSRNLFDSVLVSSSILHDDTTAAEGGWSRDYWTSFWSALVDSGAGGWSGTAVNLLDFFGKGDRDPDPDQVYFDFGPRTGMVLWGYDRTDFCADCDCDPSNGTSGDCAEGTEDCIASPWWCSNSCEPLYAKEVNYWGAGNFAGFKAYLNKYQGTRFAPEQIARHQVLSHEMTHFIHENAVLYTYPQTFDGMGMVTNWTTNHKEFWAPLGEIIGPNGSTQEDPRESQFYYHSLVNDRYGFEQIYTLRRVYWNWVMANFAGNDFGQSPPDYSDDLAKSVYDQFLVKATGDTLSNQFWNGLGRALMENDRYGGLFAGVTGNQKVQSFVHTFGMARIAVDETYREMPLGWPDPDTRSPLDFSYYEDGLGAARADVVPARITLGSEVENRFDVTTWVDPVDGSQRSYDYILPFASDYLLIQADPDYFATHEPVTLDLSVSNAAWVMPTSAAAVGWLAFDTYDARVYGHSVEDAEHGEIRDVDSAGNFVTDLRVPDFGGLHKTVVVVITNLPDEANIPHSLSNSTSGMYGTSYGMKWKVDARLHETRVSGEVSGTWTADGSPYVVTGNLTVPEGSELTIEEDVEVLFEGNRYLESYGTLVARKARFAARRTGEPFEAVYVSGPTVLDQCGFSDGWAGVYVWDTMDSVRVTGCTFDRCGSALVTSGDRLMDVRFEGNRVVVPAEYYATAVSVANRSRGVAIRGNEIRGTLGLQHPRKAIFVVRGRVADADTNLVIEGNTIEGFEYGIFAERLAPRIRDNVGTDCGTGIHVARADAVVEVTGNTFDHCREQGLYAAVDSLYAYGNSFRHSGGQGVYLADGDCYIRHTDCDSSTTPIYLDSDHPHLDLGTFSDHGFNGFVPRSEKGVCVTVAPGGAADTIEACGNYVKCYACGSPTPAQNIYCGDVECWTAPDGVTVVVGQPKCRETGTELAEAPGSFGPKPHRAWFAPNPTASGGVLSIGSEEPGPASVEVFDITGRLVRAWALDVQNGTTRLSWDGRSDHGGAVSRGVYFFRVAAPGHRTTVKVVVR